ncbi:hypothetical protein D0S45_14625 [Marinifilum sp. JC120]|nr:hypothetical protein D0S45_14625 [Marinifilum sp. JC120]
MRRFFSALLSLIIVLTMCGGVFAQDFNAQGSIIVPNFMYQFKSTSSWVLPDVVLTNITNETVTCQLRVYGSHGEDITARGSFCAGGGSSWVQVSNGGDVEIPAHSTRLYRMGYGNSQLRTVGYVEIKWASTDIKANVALVGGVNLRARETYLHNTSFLINQGNPF